MNRQSRINAHISALVRIISSLALVTVTAGVGLSQSTLKVTGEIVSASKTTINGFSAVSGATVFNNNHIRTGKEGSAIINLGRLGRIELGPETDLTLRISESSIGGELRSSQMVVSAQKGVAIAVNTAEGVVTTDGLEPAVLTIYLDGKQPRVITHRGVANIVTPAGDRSGGLRRARALAPGVIGATAIGRTTIQAVNRGANRTPFSTLFKAGITHSMRPKPGGNPPENAAANKGPGSGRRHETSITCQNSNRPGCATKSNYRP